MKLYICQRANKYKHCKKCDHSKIHKYDYFSFCNGFYCAHGKEILKLKCKPVKRKFLKKK